MQPRNLAGLVFAASLLACAGVRAAAPDYGKLDTFQPGKKYTCVPTADHKGWNCTAAGKFTPPVDTATSAPAPAPVTPSAKAPMPTPLTPPAAATSPVSSTPVAAAAELPGYLANSAASKPMQPMQAAPAPKPAPLPRVQAKPIPEQVPAQTPATPPAKPPKVQTMAPATPVPTAASDFLALPADGYVIELAHGVTRSDIATTPHPSRAKVFELHLRQNDTDEWLLLWGPFADLESARAAREELVAQGTTPGWPRRIGPLQVEAHRLSP